MFDHARLLEMLVYDCDTGVFTWRQKPNRNIRVGAPAGSLHNAGYWIIGLDGFDVLAHRLAWFYVFGEWPREEIDHKDGDRRANSLGNLRDVPHKVNGQNRRVPQSDGRSGYLGASRLKTGRFRAQIKTDRVVHLGVFDDPSSAHAAYVDAKRLVHAGCTL